MDVTWIGGKEGAKDKEDFAGAMRWSVTESELVSMSEGRIRLKWEPTTAQRGPCRGRSEGSDCLLVLGS